jgi:hypothetical protein
MVEPPAFVAALERPRQSRLPRRSLSIAPPLRRHLDLDRDAGSTGPAMSIAIDDDPRISCGSSKPDPDVMKWRGMDHGSP